MHEGHTDSPATISRLRLAELSSAVGAGVLGMGAGVLLAGPLHGVGPPILVAGLMLHAWGMTDKHRLEADRAIPAWSTALYWICWAVLAALAIYVVLGLLR